MAWPSGKPRGEKTGGRMKGTPNKRTLGLSNRLDELGIDVVSELFRLLPDLQSHQKAKVLLSLMEFIYPRRKAIDVETDNSPLTLHAQIVAALEEPKNDEWSEEKRGSESTNAAK